MAIFAKIGFWGLIYLPEVPDEHKTYSTTCGTHVEANLNHKNLTELAGGVRESHNVGHYG